MINQLQKSLKFQDALKILIEMHFGARVVRSGRRRGIKEIWWTTVDGVNTGTSFLPETTWEYIVNYAQQQLPVWDKTMMFVPGDIIEFDWQGRTQAIVIDTTYHNHYILESPAFKKGWHGNRREFGNYDLIFHRNVVKIGELDF